MYFFFIIFYLAEVKATPPLPLLLDCFFLMFDFTHREITES